jgi:hypothetical protein
VATVRLGQLMAGTCSTFAFFAYWRSKLAGVLIVTFWKQARAIIARESPV